MKKRDNKFKAKADQTLSSSKFRYLNQELYTSQSAQAVTLFKDNDLFEDYHLGYRQQVEKWPKNPLDVIIQELSKPKYHAQVIADFGCGEGRLELDLTKITERTGKIYSFDVGKCNTHVIQTDIANVPLKAKQIDVGVFSLSLMGTNFPEFVLEANRVLRPGGLLFVAEVVSRFTDVQTFCKYMREEGGFEQLSVKTLKGFFYLMIFKKTATLNDTKNWSSEFAS